MRCKYCGYLIEFDEGEWGLTQDQYESLCKQNQPTYYLRCHANNKLVHEPEDKSVEFNKLYNKLQ